MKFNKWHVSRLTEENNMYKGIKEGLAALGIAISPIAGHTASVSPQNQATVQEAHESTISDFGHEPIDRFLWNIMQVESSGGKNTNHKTMRTGIHKGQKAVGRWGLMPHTITEMLNRMKTDKVSNPPLEKMRGMNSNELDSHFRNNPKHELSVARFMGNFAMKRQGNDVNRAAYAWLMGHNDSYAKSPDHHINNHYYVRRYNNYDKGNPYSSMYEPTRKGFKHIYENTLKSEPNALSSKINRWIEVRTEQKRQEETPFFTGAPDRGRQRDKELDNPDLTLEEMINSQMDINNA